MSSWLPDDAVRVRHRLVEARELQRASVFIEDVPDQGINRKHARRDRESGPVARVLDVLLERPRGEQQLRVV